MNSATTGTRILLVADDAPSLKMLQATLAHAGHQADAARNGEEAIAILEEGHHRMVITDWEMPTMGGLELCRAIRVCRFGGYIYTIMISSQRRSNQITRGLWAGADDFLAKPFDPQELVLRIRAGERTLALEAHDLALFTVAKLVEWRGPEAEGHVERVRMYAQVLAQWLAEANKEEYPVDAHFIRMIYQTSPLHDIGKIGICDSVLPDPAQSWQQESDIMKMHTLIGAATMNAALQQYPNDEFLLMARDIAAAHHERVDGTGYPHGLVGSKIPLAARIVALANTYETLTSQRVYQQSFSHEQARAMIQQESGTHFDPEIVSAFGSCEGVFNRIRKTYAENRGVAV